MGACSLQARLRGQEGNQRLHARWQRFDSRGKRLTVANVAVARELPGWCWSLAVMDRPASPTPAARHGQQRQEQHAMTAMRASQGHDVPHVFCPRNGTGASFKYARESITIYAWEMDYL